MKEVELPFTCGKHNQTLTNVLAGGAGWCSSCHGFVQSMNHEMPTLPPELIAQRELSREFERKAKAKVARERRKASQLETTELQTNA